MSGNVVVQEQTESWRLPSGTWVRDPDSDAWRLAASTDGTVVNHKLTAKDVEHLMGARRDSSSGKWFPSDFNYSPQTGRPLDVAFTFTDSPWVPPFGAPALSDLTTPLATGVSQTPVPLPVAQLDGPRDADSGAARKLPALAPGQYRFLVHNLDVASPTLMAIEPEQGSLQVLLPESQAWMALEHPNGAILAEGPMNFRGWRMEVAEQAGGARMYLPTAAGLAVVTPSVIGLSYTLEYVGGGLALGGPVAFAGEVWLPVRGQDGAVNLIGKAPNSVRPTVVRTHARAPQNGFEAPVFDALHVIWPCEEGQLIVRLDPTGKKTSDWIVWPEGLAPLFSLGCPYLSPAGSFYKLCRNSEGEGGSLEYVQMGRLFPERVAVEGLRMSTGQVTYRNVQRIDGDPWSAPEPAVREASSEVVLPLLESEVGRTVVGLKVDAPQGVQTLLDSTEKHRAVLQVQAEHRDAVAFGTLNVTRPWLAALFAYDGHLWVHHPDLAQPLGWKLES